MGIIIKPDIINRIINEKLIKEANLDEEGMPIVEGSSYDLRAGTVIWKDRETNNVQTLHYDSNFPLSKQAHTTLQPGQMLFVVTIEEIKMPPDLAATVYSRNQLSRDGILALNTGHVDPGYEGPIIIRLINLRAIPYTLRLGEPIYTIVFQKLHEAIDDSLRHPAVSRSASIAKATKSVDEALANALYDLALLDAFIKKEDFNSLFWNWIKSNSFKAMAWLIGAAVIVFAIVSGIQPAIDLIKKYIFQK